MNDPLFQSLIQEISKPLYDIFRYKQQLGNELKVPDIVSYVKNFTDSIINPILLTMADSKYALEAIKSQFKAFDEASKKSTPSVSCNNSSVPQVVTPEPVAQEMVTPGAVFPQAVTSRPVVAQTVTPKPAVAQTVIPKPAVVPKVNTPTPVSGFYFVFNLKVI